MKRFQAWLVVGALGSIAGAAAAAAGPAAGAFAPIAHSTTLAVDGSVAGGILALRIRSANGQQLPHVTELAVRLEGRPLPIMARADGTWDAPLGDPAARSPGKLEIIVAHDGALEALDGELPEGSAAAAPAGGGALNALIHKQASWWILNVIIVLVGVVAVSRRMS